MGLLGFVTVFVLPAHVGFIGFHGTGKRAAILGKQFPYLREHPPCRLVGDA
jgi:hypothetical protein